MNKYINLIESQYFKKDILEFNIGDTVDVQVKIVEEGKGRIQSFEGLVIARRGGGLGETFTVRKISFGEGVERVFPLHSPSIEKIVLVKKGDVRRAKLYYLKRKIGKETKIEEKIEGSQEDKAGSPKVTPSREEAK